MKAVGSHRGKPVSLLDRTTCWKWPMPGAWVRGLVLVVCASSVAACALPREVSRTPRSAIEQLLLTHSVARALEDVPVPLPAGAVVAVEVSGLQADRVQVRIDEESAHQGVMNSPSWDLAYVRDAVAGHLGELGYLVQSRANEADYVVRAMVESMGTNQGKTFFGLPSIQSVVIPFALPQLTLYQELSQVAHVRVHLDLFENRSGRFVRSTPWSSGSSYYNQYTVFFFFTFRTTDLIDPP